MFLLLVLGMTSIAVSVRDEKGLLNALNKKQDIELANDIEIKGPWRPVEGYTGTIDGRGYTVFGLHFAIGTDDDVSMGFFKTLSLGGVKNLILNVSDTVTGKVKNYGVLAGEVGKDVRLENITVNGALNITSLSTTSSIGCLVGTLEASATTIPENAHISIKCNVSTYGGAEYYVAGAIGTVTGDSTSGMVRNINVTSFVTCKAKKCNAAFVVAKAVVPVSRCHVRDSEMEVVTLRTSSIGGIVGIGQSVLLSSQFRAQINVQGLGRLRGHISVGGILGSAASAGFLIDQSYSKISLLNVSARGGADVGGCLGRGEYGDGMIRNTYAITQEVSGHIKGGRGNGGGFMGYVNGTNFTLYNCYMFVPAVSFTEGHSTLPSSNYGGFFGIVDATETDAPNVSHFFCGMGSTKFTLTAGDENIGQVGGSITGSENSLVQRSFLINGAGMWTGQTPANAGGFIGKMGGKIGLHTINVNVTNGASKLAAQSSRLANTFGGSATDVVINVSMQGIKNFVNGNTKTQATTRDASYNNVFVRVVPSPAGGSTNDYLGTTLPNNWKFITPDNATGPSCALDAALNDVNWTFPTPKQTTYIDSASTGLWPYLKGIPAPDTSNPNALFMVYVELGQGSNAGPIRELQDSTQSTTLWKVDAFTTTPSDTQLWTLNNPKNPSGPIQFPILLHNIEDNPFCPPSGDPCGGDRTKFYSPFACECLEGCPGLQHGTCKAYNTADCDESWTNNGYDLCSVFTCNKNDGLCAGGTCDSTLDVCKSNSDPTKYFDTISKQYKAGCSKLNATGGICVGSNTASCYPGWKNSADRLCDVYSCTTDTSATKCGGSSMGTCDVVHDVCKCTSQIQYFDAATKTCVDGCTGLNSNVGICIGPKKAICTPGYWPNASETMTLCSNYDCRYLNNCGASSTCDYVTGKCICQDKTQYFTPGTGNAAGTCTSGCTGGVTHGVCTGSGQASCASGYGPTNANPTDPLCNTYTCDEANGCGEGGTCNSGTCLCTTPSMLVNGTCVPYICVNGDISGDKCNCHQGWTDNAGTPGLHCSKYTGSQQSTLVIRSAGDLFIMAAYPSGNYKLGADIQLVYDWYPFDFSGTLDGQGHKITEIKLQASDSSAGFFKSLSGTVQDITFEFSTSLAKSGLTTVGGLATQLTSQASIRKISLKGLINVEAYNNVTIGGLATISSTGALDASTIDISVSLTCTGAQNCTIGGFFGEQQSNGVLTGANVTSTIKCLGYDSHNCTLGGLVALGGANITRSQFNGNIVAEGNTSIVGGLAAVFAGGDNVVIEKCYAMGTELSGIVCGGAFGNVSGVFLEATAVIFTTLNCKQYTGGMAGYMSKTTAATSNVQIGKVISMGNYGGFTARLMDSNISDCFSNVTQLNALSDGKALLDETENHFEVIGGFVGAIEKANIKRCFASGTEFNIQAPSGSVRIGGFAGAILSGPSSLSSIFANPKKVTLHKRADGVAHYAGFAGSLAGKDDASTSNVDSCWTMSSLKLDVGNYLTAKVNYGAFSGEAGANTKITNSYVQGSMDSNAGLNVFATGYGAFNGRCMFSGTTVTTSIETSFSNISASGIHDLEFQGVGCDSLLESTTRTTSPNPFENDLVNGDNANIYNDGACAHTSQQLSDPTTYTKKGFSTDVFLFEAGRPPILKSLPNPGLDVNVLVYPPQCSGDNCWDYENVWIVTPSGIQQQATKPESCSVSNCLYCDPRYNNACQLCQSGYLIQKSSCARCSSRCAECSGTTSYCLVCKKAGVIPVEGTCPLYLSGGAIAGIVIAVLLVLGGLTGFLVWWFIFRKKKAARSGQSILINDSTNSMLIDTHQSISVI
ncbi:CXC-rich protein [Giardia muris]|uniref:CXC-rich protein n=1 Tax=Giardia muris TaxID=5742 RepID=A0A4Z1SKQ1_GIAMU|nr:CXC-rich protein [Giardia muris]|eukprot:TNJ26234.1 CXC-rich protein [Giardia muris]